MSKTKRFSPQKLPEKMEYWHYEFDTPEGLEEIIYGVEHENGEITGVLIENRFAGRRRTINCLELTGLMDLIENEKFRIKEIDDEDVPSELMTSLC